MSDDTRQQLLYKVEGAAKALDVSRATLYELIRAGDVESVKIGRSRRIPASALVDYINRLRGDAA